MNLGTLERGHHKKKACATYSSVVSRKLDDGLLLT